MITFDREPCSGRNGFKAAYRAIRVEAHYILEVKKLIDLFHARADHCEKVLLMDEYEFEASFGERTKRLCSEVLYNNVRDAYRNRGPREGYTGSERLLKILEARRWCKRRNN